MSENTVLHREDEALNEINMIQLLSFLDGDNLVDNLLSKESMSDILKTFNLPFNSACMPNVVSVTIDLLDYAILIKGAKNYTFSIPVEDTVEGRSFFLNFLEEVASASKTKYFVTYDGRFIYTSHLITPTGKAKIIS